ncbi:MAG: ABC transporter permease [Bryobacterales bacterium]|nr:ABC transporter permease [Bryobacterales bacterium]
MILSSLLTGTQIALAQIRAAKMRAFLTVLGVIIGTGTIIGVGSILAGLDGAITEAIRSFGANTIIVFKFPAAFRMRHLTPEEWKRKPLTVENARAIAERCPSVQYVSPYLFPDRGGFLMRARYKGNEVYQLNLGGTEEGYAASVEMKYGRFLSVTDNFRRAPVVVIGEQIQKALFPELDPTGKWIEVAGRQLEIIGVMLPPAASFPGQEDRRALLPYFTMKKMFPGARENMLVVVAYPGKLAQAIDETTMVLRQERRVPYDKPDNFWVSTAQQMIDEFRKITSTVALVMMVLSSIGLLVGGIGVMNIMLVSVTERTKEIGVRKAIGARRMDIVLQFLAEATALTFLGGLLGMLFGWLISIAAGLVFPTLPTAVPLWAVASGLLVSVGVGLFFGIWPASKAARLDPVEALRYE